MKYILISVFSFLMIACSQVDGQKMAKEICNCVEAANVMNKGTTRSNHLHKCWDKMDEFELLLEKYPMEKERYEEQFPCIDTIY